MIITTWHWRPERRPSVATAHGRTHKPGAAGYSRDPGACFLGERLSRRPGRSHWRASGRSPTLRITRRQERAVRGLTTRQQRTGCGRVMAVRPRGQPVPWRPPRSDNRDVGLASRTDPHVAHLRRSRAHYSSADHLSSPWERRSAASALALRLRLDPWNRWRRRLVAQQPYGRAEVGVEDHSR
jgi:hypothetical protein